MPIRVNINLDVNQLLSALGSALRSVLAMGTNYIARKRIQRCKHAWALYEDSVYSFCELCMVNITTSRLAHLVANAKHMKSPPYITATVYGVVREPGKGAFFI